MNGIRAHDLCDTDGVLYQLSYIKPTGSWSDWHIITNLASFSSLKCSFKLLTCIQLLRLDGSKEGCIIKQWHLSNLGFEVYLYQTVSIRLWYNICRVFVEWKIKINCNKDNFADYTFVSKETVKLVCDKEDHDDVF